MPDYKLFYFDARGRAEPIRLLFAYAGVPYEDVRFAEADWETTYKPAPLGVSPWLEVDGQKVGQTVAICRLLGNQLGLDNGCTPVQQAQVDQLANGVEDLWNLLVPYYVAYFEGGETAASKKIEELNKTAFQPRLKIWDKAMADATQEFLAIGKPNYADFLLYNVLEILQTANADFLAPHPTLAKLVKDFASLPKIAEHLKTRKQVWG